MYNILLTISVSTILEKYELCKMHISFELSILGAKRRPAEGGRPYADFPALRQIKEAIFQLKLCEGQESGGKRSVSKQRLLQHCNGPISGQV